MTWYSGVDHGVFYPSNLFGEAWPGLQTITDNTSLTSDPVYFDGQQVGIVSSLSEFEGSVSAFTYPESVESYLQEESDDSFGMSFRINSNDGYQIHILYNLTATIENETFTTNGNTDSVMDFSWKLNSLPIEVDGCAPISHLVIDSHKADPLYLKTLEGFLYGGANQDPILPDPHQVIEILNGRLSYIVVDYGNGIWSALGPDNVVMMEDETTFVIDTENASYLDTETYETHSSPIGG